MSPPLLFASHCGRHASLPASGSYAQRLGGAKVGILPYPENVLSIIPLTETS